MIATPPANPTLAEAFAALKAHARANFPDEAKAGLGGSWTAEERRGNDQLRYALYSGGYEETLDSRQHGFRLHSGFTHARGEFVEITEGTFQDVLNCLAGCTQTPDPEPARRCRP